MPDTVADAVGVMSEDSPVVAGTGLGLRAVVPPARWGEVGTLGELLVKDGGAEATLLPGRRGGRKEESGGGQAGAGTEASHDGTSGRECHVIPCLRKSH